MVSKADIISINTITEYHRLAGLSKPEHPLISVFNLEDLQHINFRQRIKLVYDFYCVSLKQNLDVTYKYGQQTYDFDEGQLFFMSPRQVFGIEPNKNITHKPSGWILFFHPDLLWNTSLSKRIKQYDFFDYSVNEALYLSEKEEKIIIDILEKIKQEYHSNIDKFSQNVIIAQIELLLTYSERFYERQFYTRKKTNHEMVSRLEALLKDYFDSDVISGKGLPTVDYISNQLNVSSGYLRSLLKTFTGLNTQQHIHEKLIEKAKEKLTTTNLSVSEIAYQCGFEHLQSFSKLFKTKTNLSPVEFRQTFN